MRFFIGLHQPSDARHFERSFISVNRLRARRSAFAVGEWMLDSGAFTEVARHGGYKTPVVEYAQQIERWAGVGTLLAAVAQDWMCEPVVLTRTGMSVERHQALTIERYTELRSATSAAYVLPVLQGYEPREYVAHIRQYGDLLADGAWVGVGSVCKRNGDRRAIEAVLLAVHSERPDLRLHGFGLKTTALGSGLVRRLLHSADSMAWSFAARKQGRNANDWREARSFVDRIDTMPFQHPLFLARAA